tara:strand:- start:1467 stop:1619 length:153 start_codon:yes stop_codon:yes gene_type:complete
MSDHEIEALVIKADDRLISDELIKQIKANSMGYTPYQYDKLRRRDHDGSS